MIVDISSKFEVIFDDGIEENKNKEIINFSQYQYTLEVYRAVAKILKISYFRFKLYLDDHEIINPFTENKLNPIKSSKLLKDFNIKNGNVLNIQYIIMISEPKLIINFIDVYKKQRYSVIASKDHIVDDFQYFQCFDGMNIDNIGFSFNHLILDRYSLTTLENLGIINDSTISIIPRLRGGKPVIYLYPDCEEIDVHVTIDINRGEGTIISKYPIIKNSEIDNGKTWVVKAHKNGNLVYNNRKHYYLFWECFFSKTFEIKEGFVVEGDKCFEFFEEKLEYLGLNEREANDFIIYWAPQMEHSKYVLISFQGNDYSRRVPLKVKPEPKSICRIFMTYKLLDKIVEIPPQNIEEFKIKSRDGFFVLEWGGAMI